MGKFITTCNLGGIPTCKSREEVFVINDVAGSRRELLEPRFLCTDRPNIKIVRKEKGFALEHECPYASFVVLGKSLGDVGKVLGLCIKE